MTHSTHCLRLLKLVLLTAFLLSLCACAAKPTPLQPGTLIFADSFTHTDSGWQSWSDELGSMIAYQAGGLRMLLNQANTNLIARPNHSGNDVLLDVDVTKINGPDNNFYGFICRYQDESNYYALVISSDSYFGVLKVKNGLTASLGSPHMQYSPYIHQGQGQNHLRGVCSGTHFSLYANDHPLIEVDDDAFSQGENGLLVGTNDTPGVDLWFDNFVALQP